MSVLERLREVFDDRAFAEEVSIPTTFTDSTFLVALNFPYHMLEWRASSGEGLKDRHLINNMKKETGEKKLKRVSELWSKAFVVIPSIHPLQLFCSIMHNKLIGFPRSSKQAAS